MIREEVENAQNIEKKLSLRCFIIEVSFKKKYLWSKLINKIYLYYQKNISINSRGKNKIKNPNKAKYTLLNLKELFCK